MNILITGHRGYIGPHLVNLLQERGHYTTGIDIGWFEDCQWDALPEADSELRGDFRQLSIKDLDGFDAVMHLAALSNDPLGDIDPELTKEINETGTIEFAKKCKLAGVERFLMASSCSIYGKGSKLDLEETDPTLPLTPYAQSKINAEQAIARLADDTFTPSFLRNATAYGYSPMFRIDLVVNNLLACAFTKGRIEIHSDGTPWRPLIHCYDIARAFVAFAEAPKERVFNQAVNIGANEENYQVKDIGDAVQQLIPEATINYTGKVGYDPRSYRVKFDKLNTLLPDFKLNYSLQSGMKELLEQLKKHQFSLQDFEGARFVRVKRLMEDRKLGKLEN